MPIPALKHTHTHVQCRWHLQKVCLPLPLVQTRKTTESFRSSEKNKCDLLLDIFQQWTEACMRLLLCCRTVKAFGKNTYPILHPLWCTLQLHWINDAVQRQIYSPYFLSRFKSERFLVYDRDMIVAPANATSLRRKVCNAFAVGRTVQSVNVTRAFQRKFRCYWYFLADRHAGR